jgi:hypothetical protein
VHRGERVGSMKVFDVVTVSCECGKVMGEGARNGTLNTIRVKDNRIEPHPALLLKKKAKIPREKSPMYIKFTS